MIPVNNVHYRVLILSTLALVILLLANGYRSYQSITVLTQNEQRTGNTQAILRALKNVYSNVQDAELGLRGYLISGETIHLQPYFASLRYIKENFAHLEQLPSEIPAQKERVELLKQLIQNRLGDLSEDINETSVHNDSEWLTDHNMNESHNSMNELSQLVATIERIEYDLLDKQSQESRKGRSDALFTIAIANGALFLMIVLMAVLVKRSMDQQHKQAELLELKVAQRTYELQHFSNELKRSNRELQDFAFVASHDLQEPLRKIRAFGDRLASKFEEALGGDGADYIQRMQKAAKRMSNLIDDLLTFSRVSTTDDEFKPVDLNDIIAEVLENLEMVIEEKNASIEVAELPTIDADSTQMKQLFQNLISNALKFSRPDVGPIIQISVAKSEIPFSNPPTSKFELTVGDNGIGFDEKFLDRIFTPFQRLHGKNEFAGTGIGLSICRRIVERHSGQITATSTVGEGTCFIIELPESQQQIANDYGLN